MANADAKTPVMNKILNSFSHWFLLMKMAERTAKRKKNSRLSTPPDLVGEPNMLKPISCENIVDTVKMTKKPVKSIKGR